jgi:uncharacterized protein (TIGR03118 family)
VQTNLVSDIPGLAQVTDPNLVNPWGISFGGMSPFWVSNQGTNTTSLYTVNASGISSTLRSFNIPTTDTGPQGPTGQVFNNTSAFLVGSSPAAFIFANLNGTISAWNGGPSATVEVPSSGAIYTGLAIGTTDSGPMLYAADGSHNRIDAFDGSFQPVDLGPNAFVDPQLPDGLVPFNVKNLGGTLFVTYAPAGRAAQISAPEGVGAVAMFDTSGNFIRQVVAGSKLASPWGITMAPATFGQFGGALLVGNFSFDVSEINAFDPATGDYLGTLSDASGQKLLNPGLWALTFGNGGSGGLSNTLYFAAGIQGEMHGLFGAIDAPATITRGMPIVTNLANTIKQNVSTVPMTNGDENPYGVAFVPPNVSSGQLHPGDILVSNFNNSDNLQGTGTTIVRITPTGERSVFFQGQAGLGLTTALGVLKSGFVLVGNVPTDDGTFDTIHQGSLLILDSNGHVVETLTSHSKLDGPWDLTVNDQGPIAQVFVSNVLSGTVTRIDLFIPRHGNPRVLDMTQIGSGYAHEQNDTALVVGPTGLAFDARRNILYVASTDDNAIYAIPNAGFTFQDHGKGRLIYQDDAHLHGPLALALAPNGDLITANGDAVNEDDTQPSELVEFTPTGHFVGQFSVSPDPGGAFGLALSTVNGELRIAAVDDNTNTLDVWTFEAMMPGRHGRHHEGGDDDHDG